MNYILGLGSNLGNKSDNLNQAILHLKKDVGLITKISSFHTSRPEGFYSANVFLNCCLEIQCHLTPIKLLKAIKNIEKKMGREYTKVGYEDRIIDIDIILTEFKFSGKKLDIPHKHYVKRDFVLMPLIELADIQDPLTFLRTQQLIK